MSFICTQYYWKYTHSSEYIYMYNECSRIQITHNENESTVSRC